MSYLTAFKAKLGSRKVLLQNFSYLSLLQLFNMIMPLLTYPYLIRVLHKELYGLTIFVTTIVSYLSLLINFGFQISATKEIAKNRHRKAKVDEIVSAVFIGKAALFIVSAIVFVGVVWAFPQLAASRVLCLISLTICINDVLLPSWFFQGVEDMKYVTIVNVLGRIVSIILIFVLVKQPGDYLIVPGLSFIGGFVGAIYGIYVVYAKYSVRFTWQAPYKVSHYLKQSLPIFATNITAVIKDRTNIVFIGSFLGTRSVAYYDLASKIVNILVGVFFNISTAIFPSIAKSKDAVFFLKVRKMVLLAGVAAYVLIYVCTVPIVLLFGGHDMLPAVPLLRLLALMLIISPISSMIGLPLLVNNLYKQFYRNALFTTGIYLLLSLLLYVFHAFSEYSIVLVLLITLVFEIGNRYWFCTKYGLKEWVRIN